MNRMLGVGICLSLMLMVQGVRACQACLDKGEVDNREPCRACNGSGKVSPPSVVCPACSGRGVLLDRAGTIYRGHQGTRQCKMCRGSGTIQPDKVKCTECKGQGVIVTRVPCPICKGKSAGGGGKVQERAEEPQAPQTPQAAATKVATVQVETCTRCGPDGKIKKTTTCERCEKGFNHKKVTENGKDVFKCRKCGKVCADRFTPCECKTPDCPECDGKFEKTEYVTCDVCGGDKIITPLEKAKMKQP